MALDTEIIEFLQPIDVAKNISIDGRSLGENAFTSTTIPTNNNQLVNGEGLPLGRSAFSRCVPRAARRSLR